MKLLEQIERINRLHELIRFRRTGTPVELAERLEISTSMVFKVMEELRLRGAPILYSRQLRTYYYSQPYIINISLDFHLLPNNEQGS